LLSGSATPRQGAPCSEQLQSASLVLKVAFETGPGKKAEFLFTGDIAGKAREDDAGFSAKLDEQALLKSYGTLLRATVLQVPHHGDETSSTTQFIRQVRPKYAIISANPRLRIPSESVATRYEDVGATVLRTYEHLGRGNDDIRCGLDEDREVTCSFEDALE
jgi:Predicted hydrolase (metallo-beta-lactamase superfamily)